MYVIRTDVFFVKKKNPYDSKYGLHGRVEIWRSKIDKTAVYPVRQQSCPITNVFVFQTWFQNRTFIGILPISWYRLDNNPTPKHHDDVIKWKHFPRNLPFVRGMHTSPMDSPHKGQRRGSLMCFVWCVPGQTVKQTVKLSVVWDTLMHMWRHGNVIIDVDPGIGTGLIVSRVTQWWRLTLAAVTAACNVTMTSWNWNIFVRELHRSPVNSPHKGQWRGALMFSLICAWTNSWGNNGDAGDFRHHRAHYDVIVMV